MDNGNPEECIVCLTNYDDDLQRPRTVPCGHTFCSQCIETTITTDNNQYFTCPSCRTKHSAMTATQFPINYGMEAFIRKHKSMLAKHCQGCPAETHKKIQLLVKEHKSSISNLLVQCDEVLFQLDKYQEQVRDWKTQHHLLEARLYDLLEQNKAAIELLEKENTGLMNVATEGEAGKQQLHTWLECLDTLNTVEEINKTITESDPYRKEAENWIQKCQQLVPDASIFDASKKVKVALREALDMMTMVMGTTVVPIRLGHTSSAIGSQVDRLTAEFSLYKLTVEHLREMSETVKKLVESNLVFAVQQDQDGLRSSRVTLQDGQLYLHSLLHRPPPTHAHTLQHSDIVKTLDHSSILTFLDLAWPGTTRGRVHIRLSPDTVLARQFVLLCTGERGPSYFNTKLLRVVFKGEPGECVWGGDYQYNDGRGGAPLLSNLYYQQYRQSGKAGALLSLCGLESHQTSQFCITTRDDINIDQWEFVYGEVESGLDVVRAAVNHSNIREVTVVDCGVVFTL